VQHKDRAEFPATVLFASLISLSINLETQKWIYHGLQQEGKIQTGGLPRFFLLWGPNHKLTTHIKMLYKPL